MDQTKKENTRRQDIPYSQLSQSRKVALFAKAGEPDAITNENIGRITPFLDKAVKVAEGNKRNFGAINTTSTPQAQRVLTESIQNNYIRWVQAGKPGTFIDFMRDRWAPIGVANDPKNLNANWNNNVRRSLLNQLGPELYKKWEQMNLVRTQQLEANYAV